MNNNKVDSMKKLFRTVALLGSVAMLTLATGIPAQAASPSPSPSPSPTAPKATPSPKASPKANTAAKPSPLPANAAKPGVKPKAAARVISRAAPVTAPSAMLPATNCLAGACSLWAQSGTIAIPGDPTPVPIWGFSTSAALNSGVIGGPTLIVNESESVKITLVNNLPSPSGATGPPSAPCPADPRCISLDLPALAVPTTAAAAAAWQLPDSTGVAFGASKTYNLGLLAPGTYLYEAGPTPHGLRQLKMGLAGLLIVRPKAYATVVGAYDGALAGTTTGAFQAEAVAALNEFDPEFNRNPFVVDPIDFNPSVFTLNGRAFNPDPLAAPLGKIDVGPGNVLLLRYANLGSHDRGLSILNHRQSVLAEDSNILRNPTNVATQWLTAGQVSDAFVMIDPQAPYQTHIPIFESGYHLNNGADMGLGGAMSYLDVVSGVAGVPAGPLSTVTVPAPTNTGTQPLSFTATIAASVGGGTITDAEWFLDGVGQPGTGYKFTSPANALCTPSPIGLINATVNCTMSAAQVNNLLLLAPPVDGDHIIWAHGLDANGWGVVSGDVFTVNATGPLVGSFSLHLSPTNGSRYTDVANGATFTHVVSGLRVPCTAADVAAVPSVGCPALGDDKQTTDLVLLGTASASLSDWVVQGGEYCLVKPGQTITACAAAGAGIDASKLIATPGPTAGSTPAYVGPYSGANAANFPDACVPVPSPAGVNPAALGAAPGGGSIISFCAVVPTATLASLTVNGDYKLYFHAYEVPSAPTATFTAKPGRWGSYNETDMVTFTIDRQGPSAGTPVIDHNPNNGTVWSAGNLNFLDSLQVASTLDDTLTGNSAISSGEVFLTAATVAADPVPVAQYGTGAEMVPTGGLWDSPSKLAYAYIPLAELTAYPQGKVRFWVHGKDIAGNWGAWSNVDLILDRTAPIITSTTVACVGLTCTITFRAYDPVSGGVNSDIVQGEWFTGIDPGQGLGLPLLVTIPSTATLGTPGTVNFIPVAPSGTLIHFRIKDAAGNWSLTSTVTAL